MPRLGAGHGSATTTTGIPMWKPANIKRCQCPAGPWRQPRQQPFLWRMDDVRLADTIAWLGQEGVEVSGGMSKRRRTGWVDGLNGFGYLPE